MFFSQIQNFLINSIKIYSSAVTFPVTLTASNITTILYPLFYFILFGFVYQMYLQFIISNPHEMTTRKWYNYYYYYYYLSSFL